MDTKTRSKKFLIKNCLPYLFVVPALFLVGWISIYSGYRGFIWSLFDTKYVKRIEFIGFDNYLKFLSSTRGLENILRSVTYVGLSLSITIPLGLLLAWILGKPIAFRRFWRTILIIPWVISQTIAAMLWMWMLNSSYGLVNYWLRTLGFEKIIFLGNPQLAMISLVVANSWMTYPFAMVMLLAAMQSISETYYEAAQLDGASEFQSFTRITLPLIRNTLLITIIMLTLLYFNMVTLIFVLTGGGPGTTTETLSYRVFSEAFLFWRLGYSTAIGMIIFAFNVVFTAMYLKLGRFS